LTVLFAIHRRIVQYGLCQCCYSPSWLASPGPCTSNQQIIVEAEDRCYTSLPSLKGDSMGDTSFSAPFCSMASYSSSCSCIGRDAGSSRGVPGAFPPLSPQQRSLTTGQKDITDIKWRAL